MSSRPEPDLSLQAAIEAEKFKDGPASPDLCKKLGIDLNDLNTVVPGLGPQGRPPKPGSVVQLKSDEVLRIEAATKAVTEEMVRMKEAVLTVLATYVSNRDARWWARSVDERDTEIRFVAGALVHTYFRLENECPPK